MRVAYPSGLRDLCGAASGNVRVLMKATLILGVCDSLKFGEGTADNLDMGNTASLQQRNPGSRTERVGA
jgi:hypothetical protein